jgi:hypothetical protein
LDQPRVNDVARIRLPGFGPTQDKAVELETLVALGDRTVGVDVSGSSVGWLRRRHPPSHRGG